MIFILIIPGYNLINILMPDLSRFLKIGLVSIFSLGLEIIVMLLYYIIGFSLNYGSPFYFDLGFLIFIFTIISCILIIINFYKSFYSNRSSKIIDKENKVFLEKIRENNWNLLLFFLIILDLILLCTNVYLNRVSFTPAEIYTNYSNNWAFFYNVDIFFYLFYSSTIILIVIFAVKSENKLMFLFLICIFLYVQLIIPYLQIGGLFNHDSTYLLNSIEFSEINGLTPIEGYGLTVIIDPIDNESWWLRYATSSFLGILLYNLTGIDLELSLIFLFPLIFCLFPFFIYGVLEYFSKNGKENDLSIKIITFFSIFNHFFLKLGHTASTTVIGFFIFFVLLFLLYIIYKEQTLSFKKISVMIFLYLFLCVTHIEEALYFILIFIAVEFYYVFIRPNLNQASGIKDSDSNQSFIKKYCFLFCLLVLIFYLSQEFLGYFYRYVILFKSIPGFNIVYDVYISTKIIPFPFIIISYTTISYLLLSVILVMPVLLYFLFLLLDKRKVRLFGFVNKIELKFYQFQNILQRKKIKKIFQGFLIILPAFSIILLHIIIESYLSLDSTLFEFQDFWIILEVFLVYNYFIIQVFILCKNFLYYRLNRQYEQFLIVSIFCMSASFGFFALVTTRFDYSIYDLQKTLYMIFFLNNFLIKENYFKDIHKNKYIFYALLISTMILGGLNISFRKLRYG